MERGHGTSGKFLIDLNNTHDSIKFTLEHETENSLPFLDALITKTQNGPHFTTYTKPYASGLTLNFRSFHSRQVINSVMKGEVNRVMRISDDQDKDLEKLKNKLKANDYPEKLVNNTINEVKSRMIQKPQISRADSKLEENNKATLKLKFCGKKSYKIKKTAKKFGIRTVFQRPINLQGIFAGSYKPRNECNKGLIYKIECGCKNFYIGETGGDLTKRKKEHIQSIKKADQRNGFACHVLECNEKINFENAEILGKEGTWKARKIKESLMIQKLKPKINKTDGFTLSGIWKL